MTPRDTQIPIDVQKVKRVYIGKHGRCCCGCSGKYYCTSQHVDPATQNKVSDRMVKKVVDILNMATEVDRGQDYVSTVSGNKLYIAYFM